MKRAIPIIWSLLLLLFLLPRVEGQEYYTVSRRPIFSTKGNAAAAVPYVTEEGAFVVYTAEYARGISRPQIKLEGESNHKIGKPFHTILSRTAEIDTVRGRVIVETGGEQEFIPELVTQNQHQGPVSYTGDYKTMVFSRQRKVKGEKADPLGLYFLKKVDGRWDISTISAYEYNDDKAWLFSPALSPDGRTLFFAANFPGGEGGFDLYFSRLKGGSWSEPKNLGPGVNTGADEHYPFYHSLSGRLCFSSDGHDNNVAGFDLFETWFRDGAWTRATKLPAPFNSLSNDYHVWFREDLKFGFLTTNRRIGSKEIFYFTSEIFDFGSPDPIKKTYYKYRIYDRKLDTVDTTLFRYSWVINDTLELPGHEVIYRFPGPGVYVCKLNVFDIQMDTLVEGQTVKTLPIKLHEQAVIDCPDTVRVDTPVTFDGSRTYLPGVDVGRYAWDFGDGKVGQGSELEHAFTYPATYRVVFGVERRQDKKKKNRDNDSGNEPEVYSCYKYIVVIQ